MSLLCSQWWDFCGNYKESISHEICFLIHRSAVSVYPRPMNSLEGGSYVCGCVCLWFPVNLQGNQSLIFFGRPDAEAEASILWPPDAKSWLIGKDPDAGKDWRREEKGTTEDEMVGWHQWLNGHEFEQTMRDNEGQRTQACCSLWGCKESDMD